MPQSLIYLAYFGKSFSMEKLSSLLFHFSTFKVQKNMVTVYIQVSNVDKYLYMANKPLSPKTIISSANANSILIFKNIITSFNLIM